MATLLMRTPEFAGVEKLSMANIEQTRLQTEKALSRGEHEGQHKTSAEGRSRARKGKNGAKKQPQRGLGVAQLEKLLQEQSKQEAACLASLQSLPSFGFTDQNGGICFRPMKATIAHHTGTSSSLSFCNGRLGHPEKLSDYLAGEAHRAGKATVDGDVFRTIMSLATSDHSSSGSLSRHAQGRSISIMLPRNKEDNEPSYVCNTLRAVPSMTSLTEMPGSKAQRSCGNSPGTEESADRLAPCALACLGSPPKPTTKPTSFFSTALTSRPTVVDSQASNVEKDEKRTASEVADRAKQCAAQAFPVPNGVVEAGVINAKLLPVLAKDGAGALFALTNLQCYESSLGPASVRHLPRDCTDVPVVGVASNCDRPKELSSFQSFSSNPTWSAIEKKQTCGRKRPWYAFAGGASKLPHSESLDLNAPAGEIEVAHKECCSAGVAQGQECAVGAHYTTGIIWSALGNSSPPPKIRVCATWQENEAPFPNAARNVGLYSDESLSKDHCSPQSKIKDSCSSVCPPSALTLNRRRCLSSPEVPVLIAVDHQMSGDFLTLGLSSGSYPASPQLEVEVNSQETTTSEEVYRAKRVAIYCEEDDENLQLQMCNSHQELPPAVKGTPYSPHASNKFFSAVGNEIPAPARLICRLSSLSSSNMMEYCHKQTGRTKEESLDLRLKLAL